MLYKIYEINSKIIIDKIKNCILIIFIGFYFNVANVEDLYCFNYQENKDTLPQHAGWNFFNVQSEFQRQGVPNEEWSLSYLNTNYEVSTIVFSICIFNAVN